MIISRVNLFAYNNVNSRNTFLSNKRAKSVGYLSLRTNNNQVDNFVYFGATIPVSTHKEFRSLTKDHLIHCIYCKKPMISGVTLNEMLEKGVFSGPVSEFVNHVLPYRQHMKLGQQRVFDQICRYARKSPQTHLSEIIQYMYRNSIKRLVRSQAKVFKLLIDKSEELPPQIRPKFRKFMKNQHKRLYEVKHIEEFNPGRFAYKIGKLCQSVPIPELREYMLRITSPMCDDSFKHSDSIIPKDLALQITKSHVNKFHTAKDFSEYVIYRLRKIGERLDRKDIVRLCETSQRMIDGKPVIIPFSNKEFLEQLASSELVGIKKTELYYEMLDIATRLPNSKNSMNSFVVKHRYSNSDTIGYQLLKSAKTTIEHQKPRTEGGSDSLQNCVLACLADNSERGAMPQYVYLEKWNKKNPQTYFNDVIKISNEESLISPDDIKGQAQTLLDQGHIKVDISGLKDK